MTLHSQLSTLEVSPQTRVNFVYVPQGNTLFSGTIRDNLLMGNPHATETDMFQSLRTACADFVFSLPQSLDTNLNEQGGGLSEGQAQRIAIARALLRPGHILLLDEATSALDPETERQLIKNLRKDCTGKTFIFITHHPAVAEACEASIRL
nr:ATP-binding cassette domain-containing protein [Bacteroides stercorirosoris]